MTPDDDDKTPIQCLACGGHWRIERPERRALVEWCRWCIEGVMTAKQSQRWHDAQRKRKRP